MEAEELAMYAFDQGNIPNSAPMAAINFNWGMNGFNGLAATVDGLGFDWGAFTKLVTPLAQAAAARIQPAGATIQTSPAGSLVTRQESGYPILSGGFATGMDMGTTVAIGLGVLALVLVMKGRR